MKKQKQWVFNVAIVAIALGINSCNLFEKAGDVTFDVTYDLPFVVEENATGTNVPYTDFRILDAASNSDFNKYKANIKEIKINKITYRVSNFASKSPTVPPVFFNNGTASFGPADTSTKSVTATMASASGVNLQTATAEAPLTIDQAGLNTIAALLLNSQKVKMYADGVLTQTPVSFTVTGTFYVTITANALK